MTQPSDAELVNRTRTGDKAAYGELVARYQGHVYGLAHSFVNDWAEAQDIAQEAFIRAYCNLAQLRDPARFAAWLRRVAFGVAMNWLRAFRPGLFKRLDGRVDPDGLEIPDFRPGPPEVVARRDLANAVLAAVASLPPKYRVPLMMFHLDGLSYQKVADFLEIPLGTVKSLIHRAKAKLRAVLAAAAQEEITPMVQEVFNEHKLPEEFARKVLDSVPTLAWGTGRECTFAGALEAAMAVTEHPYTYAEIMGFSGLAFRARWFHGHTGARWCPSSPIGELPEESAAVQRATGWRFREEWHWGDKHMDRFAPDIAAAINAGRPVLAYEPKLNVDVVYGYADGGKTLLLRDYFKGNEPLELPAANLGPMLIFLNDHAEPLGRRLAVIEAMNITVRNWRRDPVGTNKGKYFYGEAAFARWADDIVRAEEVAKTDAEWDNLFFVSWWNFGALADARNAAVSFLGQAAATLKGDAREALERVVAGYQQEGQILQAALGNNDAFFGPWSGKSIKDWSADVQKREHEILTEACKAEAATIAEIENVLAALGA